MLPKPNKVWLLNAGLIAVVAAVLALQWWPDSPPRLDAILLALIVPFAHWPMSLFSRIFIRRLEERLRIRGKGLTHLQLSNLKSSSSRSLFADPGTLHGERS